MTTTINISHLQIFFDKALDVDELLHRITQRIQNIDLPSPGDLTPIATPLPAAPDPVTPIAPTEPPVTAGVTIAQLDPTGNLELLQKPAPSLRSLPASAVAPAERDALFYVRFPNASPQHRNGAAPGTRKPEATPVPTAPAPGSRKQQSKPAPSAGHHLAADLATKRAASGAAMDFDQFDALVRKECRRLSSAGIMPSHSLWNEMRDPTLPTLSTVITRYGAANAEDLAKLLGYSPPLRGPRPAQTEATGSETQTEEIQP